MILVFVASTPFQVVTNSRVHIAVHWDTLLPVIVAVFKSALLEMLGNLQKHSFVGSVGFPGEVAQDLNKIFCEGAEIGVIGMVHPTVLGKIDKKANVVFAEIDVAVFSGIKANDIKYDEPSKFPGIEIDLSFVTDKFAPVGEAVKNANCELIKDIQVVDTYEDENGKSITVRLFFVHPEKTLTRDEVMNVVNSIIDSLSAKGIELKK